MVIDQVEAAILRRQDPAIIIVALTDHELILRTGHLEAVLATDLAIRLEAAQAADQVVTAGQLLHLQDPALRAARQPDHHQEDQVALRARERIR